MAIKSTKSTSSRKAVTPITIKKDKTLLFDVIPVDAGTFFCNLGYKETSWRSQKTRISNKLDMVIANSLSPLQIYEILKMLSNANTIVREKARAWLKLYEGQTIEDKNILIGETFDIPEALIKKYEVTIEDTLEKHNIIKKTNKTYIKELNKKIGMYKFDYDLQIALLLKEMYSDKLIPNISQEDYKKYTAESKYTLAEIPKSAPTYKYTAKTKDNTFSFNNLDSFAEENGLTKSVIRKCLSGKQKTHKGFSFIEN